VVLAVRGSLNTHDAATDAMADPVPFPPKSVAGKSISEARNSLPDGYSHQGVSLAAAAVIDASFASLEAAMLSNPGYKLVVTGHSLGGGASVRHHCSF
jgi:hypothetical protein